jgi:hypothetical protein
MQIRVSVYALDPELRAWLLDELQLMTGIEAAPTVDAIAPDSDLVIVGLDRLPPDQLSALRAQSVRVIAIGVAPDGVAFDRVLPVHVTSRQLGEAVRELLHSAVAEPTI